MTTFDQLAEAIPGLLEVVWLTIPDRLLVHHWARKPRETSEELAGQVGDLFESAQIMLRHSGSGGPATWVSAESAEGRVLLATVGDQMLGAFVFDGSWPLGMVRAQVRQLVEAGRAGFAARPHSAAESSEKGVSSALSSRLPPLRSQDVNQVRSIVEVVRKKAPEPDAVLSHLARAAGISVLDLAHPERLSPGELRAILDSVPRTSH
ncbi:MAG: hypothetical protein ACFB9M_05960 [Myxococcota bacterium]